MKWAAILDTIRIVRISSGEHRMDCRPRNNGSSIDAVVYQLNKTRIDRRRLKRSANTDISWQELLLTTAVRNDISFSTFQLSQEQT